MAGKRVAIFLVALAPFVLAGIVALVIVGKSTTELIPRAQPVSGPPGAPGAPPAGIPRPGASVVNGNLFRAPNIARAKAALVRQAGPRARLVHAIVAETSAIFGVARGGALFNYLWVLQRQDFLSTPTPSPGAAQGRKTFPLSALDPRAPGRIVAAVRRLARASNAVFSGLNLSRNPVTGVLYWSAAVRLGTRTGVFSAAPNGTRVRRVA